MPTRLRLAHGWRLVRPPHVPAEVVREFIRPAIRAVPRAMARRLKACEVSLPEQLDNGQTASRWTETENSLEIDVATGGVTPHDLAMELLICVGQAVWEVVRTAERAEWLRLLNDEINQGVSGEIDEDALDAKRRLLASSTTVRSRRQLDEYARISFASTAAEYVHCLWHDVTVRTGSEHLPAEWLRRRLELMHRRFPPDRGYRLFPGR